MVNAVKQVYDMGVPLNLHANGDGAIDCFCARTRRRPPATSARTATTMIHSQFVRQDQLDKYVAYKIRPSFYTLHTYYFAEAHIANRGKAQADLHQPDARRDRQGPAADQPHRLRRRAARPDVHAVVGGEPRLACRRRDRRRTSGSRRWKA